MFERELEGFRRDGNRYVLDLGEIVIAVRPRVVRAERGYGDVNIYEVDARVYSKRHIILTSDIVRNHDMVSEEGAREMLRRLNAELREGEDPVGRLCEILDATSEALRKRWLRNEAVEVPIPLPAMAGEREAFTVSPIVEEVECEKGERHVHQYRGVRLRFRTRDRGVAERVLGVIPEVAVLAWALFMQGTCR